MQPAAAASPRAMRKREVKKYVDDNVAIAAVLRQAATKATSSVESDTHAAIAAGLPPHSLADFERTCGALPESLRRKTARVCAIRNHMLHRASRAPAKYLTLAEAVKGLHANFQRQPSEGGEAADAAAVYECLCHHGHLNWGVLDGQRPRLGGGGLVATRRRRVVVIGAGAAGLAAARQLHNLGHEVIVLEARERTGGRVHTVQLR